MSCNRLRADARDHLGLRLAVGQSASPARRIASRLAVGRRPTGWEMDHNLAKVGVVGSNPIARSNNFNDLEPIREVWIHDEAFAASRLSMMRIMARRTKAATVMA